MSRRLNISLPDETVRLLDRVAAKGERSQVVAEAVTKYVVEVGKARIRKRMKERAVKRAELAPPKRGDVVVVGSRPALVIQNDIDNRHSRSRSSRP